MKLDRRNFIGSSAAIAAALSAPTVMASGKPELSSLAVVQAVRPLLVTLLRTVKVLLM